MVAAFDVQLDIALTRGHAGNALKGAKNAFAVGSVEAARLADIMRQVDISAAGSLGRQDFLLALNRAGVLLEDADKDHLFRAFQSAGTGRGCDIEMFSQLVKFWAGDEEGTASLALGADERECSLHSAGQLSNGVLDHEAIDTVSLRMDAQDPAPASDHPAGLSECAMSEHDGFKASRGGHGVSLESAGDFHAALRDTPAAAGKKNSFSTNMNELLNHSPRQHGRTCVARRAGPAVAMKTSMHASKPGDVDTTANGDSAAKNVSPEHEAREDAEHEGDVSAAELFLAGERDGTHDQQHEPPDEAYMHSLGYGTLSAVLPILLDRRTALQISLERLDRSGTGRVRPSDFMASVHQAGVALSPVQQANMMDLLERMGCVLRAEEGSEWIDATASLAAIAIAGQKAGARSSHDKSRSFHEEGTRLLDTLSSHYPEVYVSLLPSSLLLGPAALQERRATAGDGAEHVFVTSGSLRKALRTAGVLLGDADERVLWRLLLRRAQQKRSSSIQDGTGANEGEDPQGTSGLLQSSMIPLPILDDVMGFDAEEALRLRRLAQQQQAHTAPVIPAPYEDHLGAWLGLCSRGKEKGEAGDEAPLLLQKARLRVQGLGSMQSEREQGLLACLPKLGPTGERDRLPRTELTRVLQRLRVGVRSGELQNLWYHMDRNEVTRAGFRRILLEAKDILPVTFPASPCPYPSAPPPPTTPNDNVAGGGRGDSTAAGGIPVSGARLQRALNRAAYEDNVRRAAGSAMTYGVVEEEDDDRGKLGLSQGPPSPSPGSAPGIDPDLPALLQKAVKTVRELENGPEAVAALVPDLGKSKDSMRISRGGIQRALHGLGIRPRSGELQQLWWMLEKGGVGGPRISVQDFRSLLSGRISQLELLPDWTFIDKNDHAAIRDDAASAGAIGTRGINNNRRGDAHSSSEKAVRQVRTALALVRRRVGGVIRGCQDRDLSGNGWLTEEAFFAVLKEQGILQQLGKISVSALAQAVVTDKVADNDAGALHLGGIAAARAVRYTAIVGAIDRYLDDVVSGSKIDESVEHSPAARNENAADGCGDDRSPSEALHHGDISSPSHPRTPLPTSTTVKAHPAMVHERAVNHTVTNMHDSPKNGVARAAQGWENDAPELSLGMRHFPHKTSRGWENDAPEISLGMRHYPHKTCRMAGIMGGGTLAADAGGEIEGAERTDSSSKASRTLRARETPLPPSSSWGMRELLDHGEVNAQHEATHSPGNIPSSSPLQPSAKSNPREYSDFVPAGGNPGLVRPAGSGGRRGSVGKVVSLAGAAAAGAICWDQRPYEGDANGEVDHSRPGDDGRDHEARSNYSKDDTQIPSHDGNLETPPSPRSRRQMKTGEQRDLMEAWPKPAHGRGDDMVHDVDTNHGKSNDEGSTVETPRRSRTVASPAYRPPDAVKGLMQDPACGSLTARMLLRDRALLAGLFRQLSGVGSHQVPRCIQERAVVRIARNAAPGTLVDVETTLPTLITQSVGQARDGLDRIGLKRLFRHPRMQLDLSQADAEGLADAALAHSGGKKARFPALITFLTIQAEGDNGHRGGEIEGRSDYGARERGTSLASSLEGAPIAQSIKRTVMQGRSELRLAAGDEDSRLSCAVHLRRAFRKRRKDLGDDPGGLDDCSVGASDLPGVLQDVGVILNPAQAEFLIQKCCRRQILGRRARVGGKTEAPVKAGDVLAFFKELLSD